MTDRTSRTWRASAARLGGELTVIILGVLIALWADGWVQRSAERRVESSRIVALRDNVAATRSRLSSALEDARRAAEALGRVARWEDWPDLDGDVEDLLLQGLLFGPSFAPEINVYIDLKSSGDLGLLRSAELRQALARMDATLEQLQFLQDDLISVQQLNYDPWIIDHLSLAGSFAAYLGLEGVPESPSTPTGDLSVLRNLALFKLDLVSQLVAQLGEASGALDAVDVALDGAD